MPVVHSCGSLWALLVLVCQLAVCTLRAVAQWEASIEVMQKRCARTSEFLPVRKPSDLNTTFAALLEGRAFLEYLPMVLHKDPLIVYFENFLSDHEVSEAEQHLSRMEFQPSLVRGTTAIFRNSETAFCTGACNAAGIVQTIQKRVAAITNVPLDNFDYVQALRYKEGMFYGVHHDERPEFRCLPCGSRIYSFFVYLSDVKSGGSTNFPRLGIQVRPSRGAALFFVNTKDEDPMQADPRTDHEGLVVSSGEKRGMNLWLHQFSYRHFWRMGCMHGELRDAIVKDCKAGDEWMGLKQHSDL